MHTITSYTPVSGFSVQVITTHYVLDTIMFNAHYEIPQMGISQSSAVQQFSTVTMHTAFSLRGCILSPIISSIKLE